MNDGTRVTSAKSVARKATTIAAAALGVTVPVFAGGGSARTATIGGTLLWRSLDTAIHANCTTTKEIQNIGNVNLNYYIWGGNYLGGTVQGNFSYSSWSQIASTKADKQEWCYNGDFYYEYFAANAFHRDRYFTWYCWAGSCQLILVKSSPWVAGV